MRTARPQGQRCERWVVVTQIFACGSTVAKELCAEFDLDPDEIISNAGIEDAFNEVAGKLPEGWTIELCLEKGAAWIRLVTPLGNEFPFDAADSALAGQVLKAYEVAVEGNAELVGQATHV